MSNATGPVGAFPPPPGVSPDFENPRDAGWLLNVVGMSVMAAVTTFFFGIRTYVKLSTPSKLLPEDCMYSLEPSSTEATEKLRLTCELGICAVSYVRQPFTRIYAS